MTDLELKTIRDFILRAAARFPRGLSAESLKLSLGAAGLDVPDSGSDSLDGQIQYLLQAGLLGTPPAGHTPSLAFYVITAAGDDYLRKARLL